MTNAHAEEVSALREVALRLDYMVCQITPQEFSWQDANYDRDLAHGRELLFLMADNEWVRATSETIDISRSDAVDTTIKIDVDLGRITHEAFRARTGQLWLPVLILPPLQQRLPEPDPFSTLTVTDTGGTRLPTLPNTDVRHRTAAALTEMLLYAAEARPPDGDGHGFTAARGHRLVLSAAIYRLLRREHVPAAVLEGTVPARRRGAPGPLPRFERVRRELEDVLDHFSESLADDGAAGDDDADSAVTRQLAERAIGVLRALSESAVVVVAVERGLTPTVLTVTVPSRALHQAPAGQTDTDELAAGPVRGQDRIPSWHWLNPAHWVLPRASLRLDLLLPSADADRQIQVNLPDGVSPDPSRPLTRRAELDIRTGEPPPVSQLAELIGQLDDTDDAWPLELYKCLADLAASKADAVQESLRDHQVAEIAGEPPTADGEAPAATAAFGEHLEALTAALREDRRPDDVAAARGRVMQAWEGGGWLRAPMMRRTSIETVSPDVIVARARMIEDLSQRAVPTQARINVNIAVTDSVYYSTARLSGWMSTLLMAVVLIFFTLDQGLSLHQKQVSAEVLAFVLTLFSAVQAGRLERADRSTVRGMLAPSGNPLILGSILPTVVLAVALAFSLTGTWAIAWAGACIVAQQLLLWLQLMLLRRVLARGLRPADPAEESRPPAGLVLYTEAIDYGYLEVLQSRWWRTTTADALMAGHRAHAYLVWQHGAPPSHAPATLDSLLRGGRPNADPDGRPDRGDRNHPDPGLSPPERPADVVALLRSGTGARSLTFAVFRDEPKADWDTATEDVIKIHLQPNHFTPFEGPTGLVGVFLGLDPGQGLQPVGEHPVTAVLRAAARLRLTVLEVQLPVPAPAVAYCDLQWARVQIGLRDSDVGRLTPFLSEIQRLVARAVVGVQTVAVGLPRILNPRPATVRSGPASGEERTADDRLVMASDLDVVAASGVHLEESETTQSWRVMAVGADWRSGVETEILDALDPRLRLAGLTSAILHGKAVFLLLGHRPGGAGGSAARGGHSTGTRPVTVYLDQWQSRKDLGVTRRYPLLRVHMRTPNRPGATQEVLEALRDTLKEVAPGGAEWDVWYAKVAVSTDNAGLIQLTVRLAFHPHPSAFTEIERRALALAAGKMTDGQPDGAAPDAGPDAPVNTVISVGLVNMPDLDA